MKNIFLLGLIPILFSISTIENLNAQLIADAGNDKVVCVGVIGVVDTYRIGGLPTVRGGTPPYKIEWSTSYNYTSRTFIYASDFLNDTTALNPIFRYGFSTVGNSVKVNFRLKITDANLNVSIDSVSVQFSRFMGIPDGTQRLLVPGDSLAIYSTVSGGIKPTIYKWSPDYNISNINIRNPIVWPRRSTTYNATLKDSAGCISGFIDSWVIDIISDTKEINNLLKVSIYPNPIVSASQLSIDAENNEDKTLFIYNSVGQMIYGQKITSPKINIGQFIKDNGTYFYHISSNNRSLAVGKFVKN
jgi:Secretion system C-terminal sorting domain